MQKSLNDFIFMVISEVIPTFHKTFLLILFVQFLIRGGTISQVYELLITIPLAVSEMRNWESENNAFYDSFPIPPI